MKTKAVIVDLDGTIFDIEHRRHFVANSANITKDWKSFFDAMCNDTVVEPIVDIVRKIFDNKSLNRSERNQIILCSGRPDSHKDITIKCLADNNVPYDRLMMRKTNDFRSDVIVKKEMLEEIRKDHDVYFVMDDRQEVVDFWRNEGLICLQVASGDFDEPKFERVRTPNLFIMVGPSCAGKSTMIDSGFILTIPIQEEIHQTREKYAFLKETDPSYFNSLVAFTHNKITKDSIISSDSLREQLTGDFRIQDKNDQVFQAMHEIARARLSNGLDVVLEATHIRAKTRKESVAIGKETKANIHYVVINRPLKEKLEQAGWRKDIQVKEKSLIEYHEEVFQQNRKAILNADGFKDITVTNHIKN